MPLDATTYKAKIIKEVGDDAAGSIAAEIDDYWTMSEIEVGLALPRLKRADLVLMHTYRYAKLKAIDLMLGKERGSIKLTSATGATFNEDQLTDNLEGMRTKLLDDIAKFEQLITSSRGGAPVGGPNKATAMIESSPGFPDANSGVYRGDPNYRLGSGW
ncbi:MAG: hypothetical protein QOH93_1246 [Chloroflexia bacterium]|jgi:hypothetical protein|nr:hypothetical protein [Chloroflexia bacterium]